MQGKVKMFNSEKGFGFITGDDGKDYFFHFSAIQSEGYRTAGQGDKVEFDLETSDRGPRAKNVKKVG
jgi:cold shock protein